MSSVEHINLNCILRHHSYSGANFECAIAQSGGESHDSAHLFCVGSKHKYMRGVVLGLLYHGNSPPHLFLWGNNFARDQGSYLNV